VHCRETIDEKAGYRAHDVMVRLEPGNKARGRSRIGNLTKAHERVHLVNIAPHGLGQHLYPAHQRVRLIGQRAGTVAHAHQQFVEQGEALGVTMANC